MSDDKMPVEQGAEENSAWGHIRSFVLRQGRVSVAQQRFYDAEMPKWGIPYRTSLLDFA